MTEPVTRTEVDSLGEIEVDADRLWGAQTQRSLHHFPIGRTRYVWGRVVIEALGRVKQAAAATNLDAGVLDPDRAELIDRAASEVVDGELDDHFPLVVFQTGSGTQTNMNANEVIANRANQIHGAALGTNDPIHPNDHVNASQSSNDVFPTVMHLAILSSVRDRLDPVLEQAIGTLDGLADTHASMVKVGRTHLQDATPITLGHEIGSWRDQLAAAQATLRRATAPLHELAIGGTATGTGLNAPAGFGAAVASRLAAATGLEFQASDSRLALTAGHDAVIDASAALRTLAAAAMKMANDVRWLASGPRAGIGELRIPANEPGSSIMPGKINPTQAEALTMVATHVYGNDATVAFAGSQGNFQLNTYKPIMLDRTLDSIGLLADAVGAFDEFCLRGLEPDAEQIADHLSRNLTLATALVPHVGHDLAASIAKWAHEQDMPLRASAVEHGVGGDDFDRWVDPAAMARPDDSRPGSGSDDPRQQRS